jgi:hypothetical protein
MHVKMIVLCFEQYTNLETCPICKQSRWKVVEKTCGNNDSAVGATTVKILRYFPPMSKQMSEDMLWHKKELVNDGKMRHPTAQRNGSTWIQSLNGFQKKEVIMLG